MRNMKNIIRLLLLLCMAACSNAMKPTRAAAPTQTYIPMVKAPFTPTVFGVSVYSIDNPGGLQQLADANISWTRRDFRWSRVESFEGERNWGNVNDLEQEFINANANNINVVLIINATPDWAIDDSTLCPGGKIKENKLLAFKNFVHDLALRYSQPPFNIHHFELFNEPDSIGLNGCWGDPSDPYYGGEYYGQMLMAAYPAIKAADPNAQVMIGGLLLDCNPNNPPVGQNCTSSKFLEGILVSGAKDYFDGVSFHAYDYYSGNYDYGNANWQAKRDTTGPVTLVKSAYIRNLLSSYGASGKFLMNTEIALVCGSYNDPTCPDGYNEATKAFYIAHAYAASIDDDYKASIWFAAIDNRQNSLLNPNLTPLPGYNAIKLMREELGYFESTGPLALTNGLMGYGFEKDGVTKWVVWSADGTNQTLNLTSTPTSVLEMVDSGYANSLTPGTSYTIGRYPLIIEFGS